MVPLARQCPCVSGKVCNCFLPSRTVTPIALVLHAGIRYVTSGITARIATMGLMKSGCVLVSTQPNFLSIARRRREG